MAGCTTDVGHKLLSIKLVMRNRYFPSLKAGEMVFLYSIKSLKKMKKSILYLSMSALMLIGLSCGNKDGREDSTEVAEEQNEETFEKNKAEEDAEFAVEAADAGLMEVQLGTMALTKAASPEVKQFAQKIVDDHTKANNELKALATRKNITLPTTMGD